MNALHTPECPGDGNLCVARHATAFVGSPRGDLAASDQYGRLNAPSRKATPPAGGYADICASGRPHDSYDCIACVRVQRNENASDCMKLRAANADLRREREGVRGGDRCIVQAHHPLCERQHPPVSEDRFIVVDPAHVKYIRLDSDQTFIGRVAAMPCVDSARHEPHATPCPGCPPCEARKLMAALETTKPTIAVA